jgi:hypothetical protein
MVAGSRKLVVHQVRAERAFILTGVRVVLQKRGGDRPAKEREDGPVRGLRK